jgi:biopolymer transport protein ExbB
MSDFANDPLHWGGIGRFLELGGPVVALLLLVSVVALAVILAKIAQFGVLRRAGYTQAEQALQHYRAGRVPEAIRIAGAARHPAAQVLARALQGLSRGVPEPVIREELQRFGNGVLLSLRGGFRPLEVIGSLAPLLGLFGTVLGMIKAFQALEFAGTQVDPTVLSRGIWEALLTTAVGLAVAIPVIATLNWLEARVDRAAFAMEDLLGRLFAPQFEPLPSASPSPSLAVAPTTPVPD